MATKFNFSLRLIVLLLAFWFSAAWGTELKKQIAANELYDLADTVAIITLFKGEIVGLDYGELKLKGKVNMTFKGAPGSMLSFKHTVLQPEDCSLISLGKDYLVFLRGGQTLWNKSSLTNVGGAVANYKKSRMGEIAAANQKRYGVHTYFGDGHFWFILPCSENPRYQEFQESILRYLVDGKK